MAYFCFQEIVNNLHLIDNSFLYHKSLVADGVGPRKLLKQVVIVVDVYYP